MTPDYITRTESDTKLESLRQEIRADLNALEVRLERRFGGLEAKFEGLRAEFGGLRAEMKIWLLVLTIVITPLVTTLVTRVSALAWPDAPSAAQPRR